jgi:DNA-binding SARP family transcriptional activator
MAIETAAGVVDESAIPGRQGRLALTYLALSGQRPVSRDALADAIWGDSLPSSWESALKSLISKIRTVLTDAGLSADSITAVSGCYQLRLPVDAWVDLETCARCVDVAEAAARRAEVDVAWSEATVATAIARRPFLPGEDAPWIDDVRNNLRTAHVRALEVLAQVWLARGNAALAIGAAEGAVQIEPFRESSYRLLMRAQALAGNRGEAIRTYDRCAGALQSELGVSPDPETTALRDSMKTTAATAHAQTLTIAVTDIVGSTELAAKLGDERWSELLAKHDAVVRTAVESAHGQVVKHLGDGFLLTFTSTGAALEALTALRETLLVEHDIAVRIGVHVGEPVEQRHDLFGLQVNISARINALADKGEILVSSVVKELAPPGRYDFIDPRAAELKGVPGQTTVYTAVSDRQRS